jgi:anaerobic selenocysteine-containing dehydrogenase
VVLPAAMWAEMSGTFTNFAGRVQRFNAAVPPPGDAVSRLDLAAGLLPRLGKPLPSDAPRATCSRSSRSRRRDTPDSTTARSAARELRRANAGASDPALGEARA